MSSADNKDVKFSLKVVVNKHKTKVLFAEIDSNFVDVLFSFLTLPLGRIVRILKKHYGDEAPAFGSLSSLYSSVANLECYKHYLPFGGGAKSLLLHPRSSSDDQCMRLKLDISDSHPPEYFVCSNNKCRRAFPNASVYYDFVRCCSDIHPMETIVAKNDMTPTTWSSSVEVFTLGSASFLVSDDLQILSNKPNSIPPSASSMDKAETIHITFGFAEVLDLLRASLISSSPLSDVILNNKKGARKYEESKTIPDEVGNAALSKKMNLKLMVQKSTNKLLCAEAEEDFVEFLFSFLVIPLGGVVRLLGNNSCLTSIDNLYRSITHLNEEKYFKNADAKNSLIKPEIPHGYVSDNHIFPLVEESLPAAYDKRIKYSSSYFTKGKGIFLEKSQTYQVKDDLSVKPFCYVSIISSFSEMNISLSDIQIMERQIGLEEALGILRASLKSTTALTDALHLISHTSNKRPKQENLNEFEEALEKSRASHKSATAHTSNKRPKQEKH